MKSTIEEFPAYSVLHLNGQFVGGEETDYFLTMANGVLKSEKKHLMLDFQNVTYFSSIVIGKLIKLNRDFRDADGKLFLCNVNKTLQEVFKITKVSSFVEIRDTVEVAAKEV
jgi:anti-anti-sigma factor